MTIHFCYCWEEWGSATPPKGKSQVRKYWNQVIKDQVKRATRKSTDSSGPRYHSLMTWSVWVASSALVFKIESIRWFKSESVEGLQSSLILEFWLVLLNLLKYVWYRKEIISARQWNGSHRASRLTEAKLYQRNNSQTQRSAIPDNGPGSRCSTRKSERNSGIKGFIQSTHRF